MNPGKVIDLDDLVISSENGDGKRHIQFDPSKSAGKLIDSYYFLTTSDKTTWGYEDGIYQPKGEDIVDWTLDKLTGNLYTIHYSKEVMKKIKARTLTDRDLFDKRENLFGVEDGVVDLATGAFLPYSPEYHITLRSPVKYDPAARCPNIINFLWQCLGSIDDILTVLDMFVAMATTTTWEYFVALIGPGSNGKTKFEQLITAFFGKDQITEVELSELSKNQFIRAAIKRKRALINSEVQGTKMESRWIKMISGGSTLDSDQKNRERVHFKPFCLQIFDTNSPPRFYDNSYGFQRRLIKLDFRYVFVDDPDPAKPWERKRDPELLERITDPKELSGLLNLIITRAKHIIKSKKIHRRLQAGEAAEEYDKQSHSMSSFFEECYDVQSEDGWKFFTAFRDIKDAYLNYCRIINAAPESDRRLGAYISKTLGCKPDFDHEEYGEVRKTLRGYRGLVFQIDHYKELIKQAQDNRDGTDWHRFGTDKTIDGTDGTDKQGKYQVEILREIYPYIQTSGFCCASVPSVPDSESSVPSSVPSVPDSEKIGAREPRFAEDGRDLDEEGEWEDCEYCGLPLPPSWQTDKNGWIFCPDCLKVWLKRQKMEE